MSYAVIFHKEARRELGSLYKYIADESGPERAWAYILGIREFCDALRSFPKRGTERREIAAGLRIIGYKRRCSIAFAAIDETVVILGIFYRGRAMSANVLARRLHDQ
ncbi:type II toxin-antitoxin system RelE/ParE family toxin [Rhizobium sp. TH2]|uniref:type II toxin-antitoxin system RelE/ParE family toxin n=1 Tax=Rhizobium sp. TH2 TaxID=2775403 RepID=UPI0021583F3A|nr:type II toxin-antitoxin system RelE/ParE family toxin [Rhizobium sp. TH2]UVC08529.1 type II toxin-antitoxin system RelE/ParE family toxin [Rhizobium sp. TH2]